MCWNYKKEILERNGIQCINEFIDFCVEVKLIILCAWYGSGYDYQHIIPKLKKIKQ